MTDPRRSSGLLDAKTDGPPDPTTRAPGRTDGPGAPRSAANARVGDEPGVFEPETGAGDAVEGPGSGVPSTREASLDVDPTFRHSYSRDRAILVRRLRRIEGQVRGIERMIEREEYCIDILQQTAALKAAVESISLLILEDHVQGCVRTAAEQGNADRYVEEVLDVVRRTLGKPVRTPRA